MSSSQWFTRDIKHKAIHRSFVDCLFYYNKSEIILFETKDKEVTLSVPMDGDTVWLTQEQMSSLFDTYRSSIAHHIGNIFKEGKLEKKYFCRNFRQKYKL